MIPLTRHVRRPPARRIISTVRHLKVFAAAILAVTATPVTVVPFPERVPLAIPSVEGWERISGDLAFEALRVDVKYEFYINPARPAVYEIVRYRVTDRDPVRRKKDRYPADERLQWDRDGRDIRRYACMADPAPGAGCSWQEMEKGGDDYLREVPVLLWLYGAHYQATNGRRR